MYRILRRASTSERLEGLGDGHALRHSLLRLVVHTGQLGHELEYLAEQVARDNHDSFQWIAEDDIALEQKQMSMFFRRLPSSKHDLPAKPSHLR